MLGKQFAIEARPLAESGNIIFWRDYRVTVLTPCLFRVERSQNKIFCDNATQGVWYRDMPLVSFSTKESKNSFSVVTDAAELILREKWESCRVRLDGKTLRIDNVGNLHGTYRTLDGCDGDLNILQKTPISLGDGVCSKTGLAVLDDGDSLFLTPEGEILSEGGGRFDKYLFAYGHDYRAAVQAFYKIEGAVPMIPRFALGNWWSRYYTYTDRSYLQLLNRFEEHDVPLTVATIDMDWHYSDNVLEEKHIVEQGRNTLYYGVIPHNPGWTGYSWNANLFPDYRKFLQDVHEKDLKITLNLHPALGVRYWEDPYEEFAKVLGKDATTGEPIPFQIDDPNFVNAYFAILHKPYERDGVDFWWIDWQQGSNSGIKGLDPLWALNHYHYLDNAVGHETPLILSRFSGAGAHRYPLGFTGDTCISWKTLRYLPYFTATASNIGYTWWSHDIGGHYLGVHDEELYVRSVQFGVFNPINRLHSSKSEVITKEPWFYQNGSGEIVRKWLKLRHKLLPYLYTAAYRTHTEGLALVEPLYYEYPEEKEAYSFKDEYLFGGQLLVAPVTRKGGEGGYAAVKAWIPQGNWTDLFTGEKYKGGVRTLYRTLDSIPVLVKEGGIVPLADKVAGNGCPLPQTLLLKIFAGDGEYTLYEEKDGRELFTHIQSKHEDGKQLVCIRMTGDDTVLPNGRVIKVEFSDLPEGSATVSGDISMREYLGDHPTYLLEGLKTEREVTLTFNYTPLSRLEELLKLAAKILASTEGANRTKILFYDELLKVKTVEEYQTLVLSSELPAIVIKKLLETV